MPQKGPPGVLGGYHLRRTPDAHLEQLIFLRAAKRPPASTVNRHTVGAVPVARLAVGAALCAAITALGVAPMPARAAWSAYINSRPVQQQHALDCEAAALQIALSAVGISVSQDALLSHIGQDARPPVMSNGHPVQWGNPYSSFVGDWNGSMLRTGYGVYYPPIVAAAHAAGATATGAEGWQPSQLYSAVASGDPVWCGCRTCWRRRASERGRHGTAPASGTRRRSTPRSSSGSTSGRAP